MRIGNIDVISGQVQQGYILTGYTADNAEVKVPLLVASGKKEGPTFWINAGVHGEEVSGIFAIHKLFEIIDVENLRGTIVATPVCNPLAVRAIQKVTREDHMDMDMHFPGNPDGWLTEQMAYHFFKEVREHADFLVDLHALGGVDAAPYTIHKSLANVPNHINQQSRALAKNMGFVLNCFVDLTTATGELPGNTNGALDIQSVLNGIPAIMAEMGAGNRILWDIVEITIDGLLNNLRYFGMIDGDVFQAKEQILFPKRCFPCSKRGGLALPKAIVGEQVKQGETIVEIVDFYGNHLESILAPQDLHLIGVIENPVVTSGKIVAVCGLEGEAFCE